MTLIALLIGLLSWHLAPADTVGGGAAAIVQPADTVGGGAHAGTFDTVGGGPKAADTVGGDA